MYTSTVRRTIYLSLILAIATLAFSLAPWPTKAQGPDEGIDVAVNTVHYVFGQQVTFHLEASSPSPINRAVLAYRTADNQGTSVFPLAFEPASPVSLDYVHEISRGYLKPFVTVEYWWVLENEAGQQINTPLQSFTYEDNRFGWHTASGLNAVVHWYAGDAAYAQAALDIATRSLTGIGQKLNTVPPRPLHLYLYASTDDLQGALLPRQREWIGGEAFPELDNLLIAVPPEEGYTLFMRRIIPHEITHILLYHATGGDTARVPPWLSEGLATFNEELPDPDAASLLHTALDEDRLLSLDSLCGSFPADTEQARLAYAQSASLVRFVRDFFGEQTIANLVNAYADGMSCRGAVDRVLGLSLEQLDSRWRAYLGAQTPQVALWRAAAPWLLLVLLSGLTVFLYLDFPATRRRSASPPEPDTKPRLV
ncbi:MAG: peptidase MA family metallohydrolase [Anaerolineae bacterium]|jgi:hypothetical protein|nr:peptidase MA family metallohydrolase [Anaerolineae bacterium]MDH7474212.1 peptidase MA family metallohydrolase [Anaerolineae bacterium]